MGQKVYAGIMELFILGNLWGFKVSKFGCFQSSSLPIFHIKCPKSKDVQHLGTETWYGEDYCECMQGFSKFPFCGVDFCRLKVFGQI